MKPVDQTHFGEKEGNCFAACIASILEISLDRVPNFVIEHPSQWLQETNYWLRRYFGLGFIDLHHEAIRGMDPSTLPDAYCIVSGPSPRVGPGFCHAVVGRLRLDSTDIEIVHDPHPSRAGIERVSMVGLFVALQHRKPPGCPPPGPPPRVGERWIA